MKRMKNRQTKASFRLLMSAAITCLVLVGNAEAYDGSATTPGTSAESLAGMWHGTIHVADDPLSPIDRNVILEMGADGTFYCPTHDLVTMQRDSPSLGQMRMDDQFMTFTMDMETGTRSHSFQFFFVASEERDPRVPPKLYLHDVPNGVNLHLTPVVEPSTR